MSAHELDDATRRAVEATADLLLDGGRAIAMTGAGISVESGIPDFRSKDGLWTRFPPARYAEISAFRANPREVWKMFFALWDMLGEAAPNPGHRALARLEELGVLDTVITQNIDALHQRAGNNDVVEFHGGADRLGCPACGADYDMEERPGAAPDPPLCDCGTVLKPEVVLFGEAIPEDAIDRSVAAAQRCRAVLVVGTSALVSPASQIPLLARQGGAKIVEVNLETTPLSLYADHRLVGPASVTLSALVEAVEDRLVV